MDKLKVTPVSPADAKLADYLQIFSRRIEATPPGICPLTVQLNLLETSGAQTCGKCVPCRDGIPRLTELMRQVIRGEADPSVLDEMRTLSQMIMDTADCAIGYKAAQFVLRGLDEFADEYQSHINNHRCTEGIGQTIPCQTNCPAHVHIPEYIALTAEGRYKDAINMIRRDNPFPTACAMICEHPCELRCRRQLIDSPVNIRGIKKYACDQLHADKAEPPKREVETGRRIAIIGGGPSGLTCAYFLSMMGHRCTVYESRKQLGGMMRYGIPAYRFPRERLDEDIKAILSIGGIDVKLNTHVDSAMMKQIHEEYDAVYVAIGAHKGKTLDIPNAGAHGVHSAVHLLRRIGDGEYPDYHGMKVVVIGGGNVAMDCARTSLRAGAEEVSIVYRRRRSDMTALESEVESAVGEGIELLTLEAPVSIEVDENNHCTALITQPQMVGPVKGGRPSPVKANKPQNRIPADLILIAVGQDIHSRDFEEFGMKANRGRLSANEYLESPGFEDVFVGGDCQTGPKTVIMAIGAGKAAARNIDTYMGYHHRLDCDIQVPDPKPNVRQEIGRVTCIERPARERKTDFDEVEIPWTPEEARQECSRCLRCDHFGCGVLEGGQVTYD